MPAWEPITASGPTNLPPIQDELQKVAVDAEGGTFTLSFGAAETGAIDFDAEASAVETALNGLSTIVGAGGSVNVVGGPGDKGATRPYSITFDGGPLAGTNVAQIAANPSGLSGGFAANALAFTAVPGGPGTTEIAVYAQNVGGESSSASETVTMVLSLPAGVVTTATAPKGKNWSCASGAGLSEVTCTTVPPDPKEPGVFEVAGPGFTLPPIGALVTAEPGAQSGIVEAEVSGGGAVGTATYQMPLIVSAIPAPPGLQSITAAPYRNNGTVDIDAGAHPYSASAGILVNTRRSPSTGQIVPAGELRDIVVDTPPGFFGNPIAAEQCSEALPPEECDQSSIVATVQVALNGLAEFQVGTGELQELSSVNNIEAPFGYPGKFRFRTGNNEVQINVVAGLRSDEDYGLEVGSFDTAQIKPVFGSFFTFWGSPFDPGHDDERCREWFPGLEGPEPLGCVDSEDLEDEGLEEVAFLTNPVDCGEEAIRAPVVRTRVNTWQNPGLLFTQSLPLEPVSGCEELDFEVEDFSFEPTGAVAADSPASFQTELRVPTAGLLEPDKRTNPTIRETVVELPEGVVLNASAADGLQACSFEQIGYRGNDFPRPNEIRFTKAPDTCPDASKIGSGELKSELIEEPLRADLFLAEQGDGNPFGSLFAIYLVIEDPRHGIFIKLPGEVRVDAATGEQTVTFRDLPPLPFTYLKLNLKGGARSPLATPTTCGSFATTVTNTPWSAPESGPPLLTPSTFAVSQGPNGAACAGSAAARPFNLGLNAGSGSVQAGGFTDLSFRVTRPDGSQELDTLRLDLPPGLAASLRGVPYCSEAEIAAAAGRDSGRAEQSASSCPAASQVGRTVAGAGSGPAPFFAPGKLYLAGPYKGAPLSVVAITPAVAGPFDLGNVLVRSAIRVDPVTAQVSAVSDPIPQVHEGIPLRVRDIRVVLDRTGFALNPTSCSEKQIAARVSGASGAVANLATRFQVGDCRALGFKPRTRLQLFGGTHRGDYQGVRAVVRPRPGDANISRSVVRFPRSAFVAQEHIRTVCTRVQFAADSCPKGSIYGKAVALSPLLDYPLEGNVYLRSSDNALPDAVADLRGPAHQPIRIEVAIRNDSVRGALRNTVQAAPDAPVSYFRLQMFGGDKGLIVNSRNICEGRNAAWVGMRAHNGRRLLERIPVSNRRCKKQRSRRR